MVENDSGDESPILFSFSKPKWRIQYFLQSQTHDVKLKIYQN